MAAGLLIPVSAGVSCSWQCHRDRTPPSSEPGTDRGSAYGTPFVAAGDGRVIDVKTTNSNATGRYVTVRLDDGRTVRYLHLARIDVRLGQGVRRGQVLGLTGASGFGSDWYYGPHVHTTLWPGAAWVTPTIDFEKHTGPAEPEPEPEPEPERMPAMATLYKKGDENRWAYAGDGHGEAAWIETTQNALAKDFASNTLRGKSIKLTDGQWANFKRYYTSPQPVSST